tara:strand:- start:3745 stop:4674 length:930 start_codon:yes stop_codon:yes gene_type:complete
MINLKSKDLLGTKDLSLEEINLIFETTKKFKEVLARPIKKVPTLRHLTVANIFFENSTRTKLSFELAQKRLSADIINFSSSVSSVKKGESLLDTINNILVMKVDMIVMRHPNPGAPHFVGNNIKIPVINAGDGTNEHPTQALLDSYSIIEKLGEIKNKKIAIIGDISHSRVAISNIHLLRRLGAKIMLCGPSTLIPKYINEMGVLVKNDIREALEWCDVANILRIQIERQNEKYFPSLREYSQYFGINKKLLDSINKDIIIMHPGPINRGVEISSDVADSSKSIILDQVENGVAVRMAVMYLLSFYNPK